MLLCRVGHQCYNVLPVCFSNANSLHSQMFTQDAIPSVIISLYTFPAISGVLLSIAHPWSVWRPTTVSSSCIVMWVMAYHIQPFFGLYPALGQGKTMLPPCQISNILCELRSHRTEHHKRKYESRPTHENWTKSLSYKCFLSHQRRQGDSHMLPHIGKYR